MFVILVYDVGQKRVAKALKTCRKYLYWVQNSVFEGDITEANLTKLKIELLNVIDTEKILWLYINLGVLNTQLLRH